MGILKWIAYVRLETHLRIMFHEGAQKTTQSIRPLTMFWYEGYKHH